MQDSTQYSSRSTAARSRYLALHPDRLGYWALSLEYLRRARVGGAAGRAPRSGSSSVESSVDARSAHSLPYSRSFARAGFIALCDVSVTGRCALAITQPGHRRLTAHRLGMVATLTTPFACHLSGDVADLTSTGALEYDPHTFPILWNLMASSRKLRLILSPDLSLYLEYHASPEVFARRTVAATSSGALPDLNFSSLCRDFLALMSVAGSRWSTPAGTLAFADPLARSSRVPDQATVTRDASGSAPAASRAGRGRASPTGTSSRGGHPA